MINITSGTTILSILIYCTTRMTCVTSTLDTLTRRYLLMQWLVTILIRTNVMATGSTKKRIPLVLNVI